jgi:hypothetical protein
MTGTPDEAIPELLRDLQLGSADKRIAAATALGRLETMPAKVVSVLRKAAAEDENRYVREAAQAALIKLGAVSADTKWPGPGMPGSPAAGGSGTREFWTGFLGWVLINVPVMICTGLANTRSARSFDSPETPIINFVPLALNIVAIFVLAAGPRRTIAFGALTALATTLVCMLAFLPLTVSYCFSWPIVTQ